MGLFLCTNMALVGPNGPRGPANITQSVVLRFNLLEVNPKSLHAHPVPVCLLPGSETLEEWCINPKVLLLVAWLSGELKSNFAVIFESWIVFSCSHTGKAFLTMQRSRSAIGGLVGNVPFFFFSDSGPSNQLHLRSGSGASSLTHPNSYLPVQLMAYLLLPWLGRKSWTTAGSICLKYQKCLCGCSGVDATNVTPLPML